MKATPDELLIDLVEYSKTQLPEKKLHQFKKNNTTSFTHSYTRAKQSAQKYKIIFYFFSALFFALFYFTYTSQIGIKFSAFISNPTGIKTALITFSIMFSALSAWIGFHIRAEREMVRRLYGETKGALRRAHLSRLRGHSIQRQKHSHLKYHYEEALANLGQLKHEAEGLHVEISVSKKHDAVEKQQLYEQVIRELKERCERLVTDFKKVNGHSL